MTGREKWADEYARKNWRDFPMLIEAMTESYKAGLADGLNRAGNLLDGLPHFKETGMGHLIRAIGKGDVNQMDIP